VENVSTFLKGHHQSKHILYFFSCAAAAQWGLRPPHSWDFSRSHTTTNHCR